MKTIDDHTRELADQLREGMPAFFVDGTQADPVLVASWILHHYLPPVEWQEIPPSDDAPALTHERYSWTIRCRAIIAGQVIQYAGFETAECRERASIDTTKRLRRHIRHQVGRGVMRLLDGDR